MNDGLSAGDIMALTKDDGSSAWLNNPFIYLVWLALLGNGGFFGGGRNAGVADEGIATRNAIYEGNANQDIFRNFNQMSDQIGLNRIQTESRLNEISAAIAENRYAQDSCCCTTNRNIDSVKAEAYKNTCEVTNAIHEEGELTRALINQNTMQDLRDQLTRAQFLLSQQEQNAALVSALRPFPIPAYQTCSPYTSSNCSTCTSF